MPTKEYMREWRKKNPDKRYRKPYSERKEYHKLYFQRNKKRLEKQKKEYYQKNKEYFKQKSNEWYERNKERKATEWASKRLRVIKHYGGKCSCCGETVIEFLAIDHIKSDGYLHRKSMKTNIYDWAIKNNYPKTIQVLCHNCNNAKAFYGGCPHDRVKP